MPASPCPSSLLGRVRQGLPAQLCPPPGWGEGGRTGCLARLRTLGITRKAKVAPRSARGCGQRCNAHPANHHPPCQRQQGEPGEVGRCWGDPLVEQTANTPKPSRRKPTGTHPQDHTTGFQHHHGREEPGHSTRGTQQRGAQRAQPRHGTTSLPGMTPPGTPLLPKSNPGPPRPRNSPVPPAQLREHPQRCCQESNRLINPLLLMALPVLIHQPGNFHGDGLRTLHPLQPTTGRVPPSPLNHHKNYVLGSLNGHRSSPRHSYHCNRQGPRHFRIETSKQPLPFHQITMTTNTRPLSSG